MAGNVRSSASRTYTVLAWTLNGFFQPVDMNGVVEHGQERLDRAAEVQRLRRRNERLSISAARSTTRRQDRRASCEAPEDAIERACRHGTERHASGYDTTVAQYIYNWKTRLGNGPSECDRVTHDDSEDRLGRSRITSGLK